jgi:Tfp pilus assembly protein PilO
MKTLADRQKIVWTKRLCHYLASATVTGMVVLFYTSLFSPFARKYEVYEREISVFRSTLASASVTREARESLTTEVHNLETVLTNVRERIPNSPNETLFLKQMTEAARKTNVTIRAYNRGSIQEFATYSQLEVHIAGDGGYEPICRFIEQLSQLSRITAIEELKISVRAGDKSYPMEMRLLLFFNRTSNNV